jgi:hypothetical protein
MAAMAIKAMAVHMLIPLFSSDRRPSIWLRPLNHASGRSHGMGLHKRFNLKKTSHTLKLLPNPVVIMGTIGFHPWLQKKVKTYERRQD